MRFRRKRGGGEIDQLWYGAKSHPPPPFPTYPCCNYDVSRLPSHLSIACFIVILPLFWYPLRQNCGVQNLKQQRQRQYLTGASYCQPSVIMVSESAAADATTTTFIASYNINQAIWNNKVNWSVEGQKCSPISGPAERRLYCYHILIRLAATGASWRYQTRTGSWPRRLGHRHPNDDFFCHWRCLWRCRLYCNSRISKSKFM